MLDKGSDAFERARRLLARIMSRLMQQTFLAWHKHARFETTIKQMEAVIDPVAAVLEKLPENRTPEDIQKLVPLVSQIDAYKPLHPQVREFLASYLHLALLTDHTELPRQPSDNSCLFSVVFGQLTALVGDPGDPALAAIRDHAVAELTALASPEPSVADVSASAAAAVAAVDAAAAAPTKQLSAESSTGLTGGAVAVAAAEERRLRAQTTMSMYGIRGVRGKAAEQVSGSLWRCIMDTIHNLNNLQKAQAMRALAAQHAATLEDAAGGQGAGGKPGLASPATEEAALLELLPVLANLKTQVHTFKTGQSFSGRELYCQEEAGLVQEVGAVHLELPGRAIAAITPENGLAALVYVSREVYRRAMAMQSEISVRRAVDSCCRLPFLRHTPLKELYRLSRHMHEATFKPGETVLHQGRETSFLLFLVSGEVQVVADLPDSTDPLVLGAALAWLGGTKPTQAQAKALAAHVAASNRRAAAAVSTNGLPGVGTGADTARQDGLLRSRTGTFTGDDGGAPGPAAGGAGGAGAAAGGGNVVLPNFGATRRVVLGRRGSGVVLGDDLLREKRLTVGVVATSRCVCLAVSPQRFTMCCDPLTLRLFHKLRLQHSATAVFTDALLAEEERAGLVTAFRDTVLSSSYDHVPDTLRRGELHEPRAWLASSIRPSELDTTADDLYQQRAAAKAAAAAAARAAANGDVNAAAAVAAAAAAAVAAASGRRSMSPHAGAGGRRRSREGSPPPGMASPAHGSGSPPLYLPPSVAALSLPSLETAPPAKLYSGLKVALVQELVGSRAESGSMAVFLQRMKAAEVQRIANANAAAVGAPKPIDLAAAPGAAGSGAAAAVTQQQQRSYTDMLEAACMAVIKVELAPGQLDVKLDTMGQVLDDIVVQWSDLAHRFGLQLVRWRAAEYFLVVPLDLSARRRPLVRIMADTLLTMAAEFRKIVAQNEIPHLAMAAGVAIGGLFSSYDSGHFLVGCSGQAHAAAQHLCKMAQEEGGWQGTILVADSVAQALARTHHVQCANGGGELLGAVGEAMGSPRARRRPNPLLTQPEDAEQRRQRLAREEEERQRQSSDVGEAGGGIKLESKGPTGSAGAAAAEVLAEDDEDEPVSPGTRPYYRRTFGPGADNTNGSRGLIGPGGLVGSRSMHYLPGGGAALLDDGEAMQDPALGTPHGGVVSNLHVPSPGGDGVGSPASRQPSYVASRRAAGPGGGPLLPPPLLLGGEPTWANQTGPVIIPGEDVLPTPNPITSQAAVLRRSHDALSLAPLLLPGDPASVEQSLNSPALFSMRHPSGLGHQNQHQQALRASGGLPPGAHRSNSNTSQVAPHQLQQQYGGGDGGVSTGGAASPVAGAGPGGAMGASGRRSMGLGAGWEGGSGDVSVPGLSPGPAAASGPVGSASSSPGGSGLKLAQRRERNSAATSTMMFRQQLRQEVASLRQSVHQQQSYRYDGAVVTRPQHQQHHLQQVPPVGPSSAPLPSSPSEHMHHSLSPREPPRNDNVSPNRSRFAPVTHAPATLAPAEAVFVASTLETQQAVSPNRRDTWMAASANSAAGGLGTSQGQSHRLPAGIPPRRALSPMPQRAISPFIPISTVDPASEAAAAARGGGSPGAGASRLPPSGPSAAAAALAGGGGSGPAPKLIASNFGYLKVPQGRLHHGSEVVADTGKACGAVRRASSHSASFAAGASDTNGRHAIGCSVSHGAPVAPDSPAIHQYPSAAGRDASSALGQPTPTAAGSASATGWGGVSWAAGAGPAGGAASGESTPGRGVSAAAIQYSGIGGTAGTAYGRSKSSRGRNAQGGNGTESPPSGRQQPGGGGGKSKKGSTWQDLGSQRAAEQYAASLPLGLQHVSFSTAGLSRVPPLQRLLYLESLALSYNHLVDVGSEALAGLSPNLKTLTLVCADLSSLPPDFGALLPGLTELNISNNRLTQLPPTMGCMTRLRSLSISHNKLEPGGLPPSLWEMGSLEHLLLGSNKLTELPDRSFAELTNLQSLDVRHNRLAALPASLTCLSGSLTKLVASYNNLTAMPPGFMNSMERLAVLILDFNPKLVACPQLAMGRPSGGEGSGGLSVHNSTGDAAPDAVTLTPGGGGSHAKVPTAKPTPRADASAGEVASAAAPPGAAAAAAAGGPAGPAGSPFAEGGVQAPVSASSQSHPADMGSTMPPSGQQNISPNVSACGAGPAAHGVSTSLVAAEQPSALGLRHSDGLGLWRQVKAVLTEVAAVQHLPSLRVLSLSSVSLLNIPAWLPAGLQVLDVSRNNLHYLPPWLPRRLAPSLAVLRLHTNHLEAVPADIRTMTALQVLTLEENPVASPERIATPHGAGWAAEWLYRKKYRSRPEVMASLAQQGSEQPLLSLAATASAVMAGQAATANGSSSTVAAGAGGAGGSGSPPKGTSQAGGALSANASTATAGAAAASQAAALAAEPSAPPSGAAAGAHAAA